MARRARPPTRDPTRVTAEADRLRIDVLVELHDLLNPGEGELLVLQVSDSHVSDLIIHLEYK